MIRFLSIALVLLAVIASVDSKRSIVLCRPTTDAHAESARMGIVLQDAEIDLRAAKEARPSKRIEVNQEAEVAELMKWIRDSSPSNCLEIDAEDPRSLPPPKSLTLEVQVLEKNGRLLPGLEITLLAKGPTRSRGEASVEVTTDERGYARFDEVDPGNLRLLIRGPHGLPLSRNLWLTSSRLECWELSTEQVAVGRVTCGGQPVPGAMVGLVRCQPEKLEALMRDGMVFAFGRARSCFGRAWTDELGSFLLYADMDRVPDSDDVWIVAQEQGGVPIVQNWNRDSGRRIELRLRSTRRIAGSVRFANGEPAAGSRLQTYIGNRSCSKVGFEYVGRYGGFELNVDPRATSVQAIGPEGEIEAELPEGDAPVFLHLTLPEPRHSATVLLGYPSGRPIPDEAVDLRDMRIELIRPGTASIRHALNGRAQLTVSLGRRADVGDPWRARVRGPFGYHSESVELRSDSNVLLKVYAQPFRE